MKKIVILIIVVFIILIIVFSAKIYLLINFLLGNDVIIRLSVEPENLFLSNNEFQEINFKSSALTNPFCSALCNYNFIDLSYPEVIENQTFEIKPTESFSRSYALKAPEKGKGQILYRFDMQCKSIKNLLCNTKEEPFSKTSLIPMNYDLNQDEQEFKLNSKNKIADFIIEADYFLVNLREFNKTIEELDLILDIPLIRSRFEKTQNSALIFNSSLERAKKLWENGDYPELSEDFGKIEDSFNQIKNSFLNLNRVLSYNIFAYNLLIDNITYIENELRNVQKINLTEKSLAETNNLIKEFNRLVVDFNKKNTLINKSDSVYSTVNQTVALLELINNESQNPLVYVSDENISKLNNSKIIFKTLLESSRIISLKEPASKCCVFGKCAECCGESCYYDKSKFPVIFLHGHDFSKQVSAEHNLNIFDKMQRAFENDGYLNAGSIFIAPSEEGKGVLGKTHYPVTLKASYYFDIFKTKETSTILQAKKDNLDTYAIRLRDIISTVKQKTNREKVIIIAHSMGGLVTRRYLQIFGESEVDKIILIATPNKGISDSVSRYCSLFGSESECMDMDKNSLFLNKLNSENTLDIPVYNIIGVGCKTDNEEGDGIVKETSAYLENAENYLINGTCEGINLLHLEILLPEKYPEVYRIINESIRG